MSPNQKESLSEKKPSWFNWTLRGRRLGLCCAHCGRMLDRCQYKGKHPTLP